MAAKEACTTRTRWSEDMEDLLVHCWKQYECLYNVSSDTSHNKAEKERCWEEIAVALEVPVEEVKVKAASLRAYYSKLRKTLYGGKRSKATTPRQKRILTSLKFLKKHVVPRFVPVLDESSPNQSTKDMLTTQPDSDDSKSETTSFSHSPAKNVARTTWSVEKEDKLLELWQQHECLYNLPADKFCDKAEREKKWAEIAAALELPVENVKMRACSLRTQYCKLVKPQRSGRKERPMTGRQRRILRSCKFLKKYICHRSTEERLDPQIKRKLWTRDCSDSKPEITAVSLDFDGGTSPSLTDSSSVSPLPPPLAKSQPKTQNRHDVEQQKVALLQHMLDSIQGTSRQPERDCEDSFGVTVAMELKRIQNPALRNRVKREIMIMLYDALDSEQVTDLYLHQHTFPSEESHSITVVVP